MLPAGRTPPPPAKSFDDNLVEKVGGNTGRMPARRRNEAHAAPSDLVVGRGVRRRVPTKREMRQVGLEGSGLTLQWYFFCVASAILQKVYVKICVIRVGDILPRCCQSSYQSKHVRLAVQRLDRPEDELSDFGDGAHACPSNQRLIHLAIANAERGPPTRVNVAPINCVKMSLPLLYRYDTKGRGDPACS